MLSNGVKYKRRKTKSIDMSQKRPSTPRRSAEQVAADKAKAKRARKARATQRRKS